MISGLFVLVDFIGQVSIHERFGKLVCMFYIFRNQLAGWMPDGTRIGPPHLTGGPASVDGEAKFAAALRPRPREAKGAKAHEVPASAQTQVFLGSGCRSPAPGFGGPSTRSGSVPDWGSIQQGGCSRSRGAS